MATHRFVPIECEGSKLLADLEGIKQDLSYTIEICEHLEKMLNRRGNLIENHVLIEALSCAALVKYARALGSGVRTEIPKSIIQKLTSQMKEDHKFFKNVRNKHIAHSVNAFEDIIVQAYLYPEEHGNRGVSQISVSKHEIVGLSGSNVERLKGLCRYFIEKLNPLIEDANNKVLEYARNLPMDELYKRKALSPKVLTSEDAGKRRKS